MELWNDGTAAIYTFAFCPTPRALCPTPYYTPPPKSHFFVMIIFKHIIFGSSPNYSKRLKQVDIKILFFEVSIVAIS